MKFWTCTDNVITSSGARALAEALKQNSTLNYLNLHSKSDLSNLCILGLEFNRCLCLHLPCLWLDNSVGDEGARALAESLKQNMTLIYLNLYSMSKSNRYV